jgi:hypothetical protein
VIVQSALTLLVFLGLSALVVDYGVVWVSRAQAQNAADAGAIAGATAFAYDDTSGSSGAFGFVFENAKKIVDANPVWSEPASLAPLSFGCPAEAAADVPCVKVEVFRDVNSGNPLPTFFRPVFGPVLGIQTQDVRATAIAQVAVGNGTKCLKPWAVPDRWSDVVAPGDVFAPGDVYSPPVAGDPSDPGTGLRRTDLPLGTTSLTLATNVAGPITPDLLLPLVLDGGNTYDANVLDCNGLLSTFGQRIPVDDTGAPTLASAEELTTHASCAPGCVPLSPRLVALALFDPDDYQIMRATGWPMCPVPGEPCVKVVNIVGFFIESVSGSQITGHVTKYPGLVWPTNPTVPSLSSFLPAITLVR